MAAKQTADSRGGPPAVGTDAATVALAQEVTTLAASGAAAIPRLSATLYEPSTPPHIIVRAARALASVRTPEARAALQPALYGPWPDRVLAQVHAAYGRAKEA